MHALDETPISEEKIAIHWFEQSSYAVRDATGTTLLIDPYFPHARPAEKYIHAEAPHDESSLRPDAVLLTHNHSDHTCIESLSRLHAAFPEICIYGPWESVDAIAEQTQIPAEQLHKVEAAEVFEVGSMTVHAVYAKAPEGDPTNAIEPPDVTHLGFVVKTAGPSFYVSGDVFNSFADRDDLVSAVAVLQPAVGFLTCHPSEGEFPFFEGSAKMAARIGLHHAVPAHYDCFVKRNYDPAEWAAGLAQLPVEPLIIPRNSTVIYPPA